MDLEQLKDIVSKKDGEGFCQFFRQLKPEEVGRFLREGYKEILNLAQQMSNEGIIKKNDTFFAFLFSNALECLKRATSKKNVLLPTFIFFFYNDLFLNLYPVMDENFAEALGNKAVGLNILADHGVKTIENLKEAINCYHEASSIFSKKKVEVSYANTLMNKGITFSRLAEEGVNTIENLKQAVKLYDEAAPLFKREKANVDYARSMMNKGNSLGILATLGVDTIENLKESIKCYEKAAPILKEEVAELIYARVIMNKGVSLSTLAEQGVDTIENLKESIECYDDAAPIFIKKRAELDYARAQVSKGTSLHSLAEEGVNTLKNLEESIKCCNEAASIFKREWAELDYGKTLVSKGLSLIILAQHWVDVEENFASAMEFYQEAEGIFLEKGSLINFVMASANHIIGLWWRFLETNKEDYLIQAKKLCEQALAFTSHTTHPAKASIIAFLVMINDILADKYLALDRVKYNEIIKRLKKIERHTELILPLEEKIDLILSCIEKSTTQIIKNIKRSGEKVSEEVARGFTSLADDLKVLTEEQKKKLLEELCRLLTNPTFQKNFLRKSPLEKRGAIRSIFQRIGETAKDVDRHMPEAMLAHLLDFYINNLTVINPHLVWGSVIVAFITFKSIIIKKAEEDRS